MHDILFCKRYLEKSYRRILKLCSIKFANISENIVLANNIEITEFMAFIFSPSVVMAINQINVKTL